MQFLVAPFEKSLGELLFQQQQLGTPIPVPLTLAILRQVCEALHYAHTMRDDAGNPMYLLHRDVTPACIMVGYQGAVRLIASMAPQANPAYVAPEILLGMQPDARADLFSLGVVAHEMLTGLPLFHGVNEHDTLARVCQLPIPSPSMINPAVAPDLDGIVLTALARDPTYRWQSAAMMRDGLASIAQHLGLELGPDAAPVWAALFEGRPFVAAPPPPQPVFVEMPASALHHPPPPPAFSVDDLPQASKAKPSNLAAKTPAPVLTQPSLPSAPARPSNNPASKKTPAPVLTQPLPSAPARAAVNPASNKTPAPVLEPSLPSAPERRRDNPAAKTPAPVFQPSLPEPASFDERAPQTFDDSAAVMAPGAFDDAPATIAAGRRMATVPAEPPVHEPAPRPSTPNPFEDAPATMANVPAPSFNAFDDAPATMASMPAFSFDKLQASAFDDAPATMASMPAFEATPTPNPTPVTDRTLAERPSAKVKLPVEQVPAAIPKPLPRRPIESAPTTPAHRPLESVATTPVPTLRSQLESAATTPATALRAPLEAAPTPPIPHPRAPIESAPTTPVPHVKPVEGTPAPRLTKPFEAAPAPRANRPSKAPDPNDRSSSRTPRPSQAPDPRPSPNDDLDLDALVESAARSPAGDLDLNALVNPETRGRPDPNDRSSSRTTRPDPNDRSSSRTARPDPNDRSSARTPRPEKGVGDLPQPRSARPEPGVGDLPAPRPSRQHDVPDAPRIKQPTPKTALPVADDDAPAATFSPPSAKTNALFEDLPAPAKLNAPSANTNALFEDLPAPAKNPSAKPNALFEDLPAPAKAPAKQPTALFDDLPAPVAKPVNLFDDAPKPVNPSALFEDLPAPRGKPTAPPARALSNFDDDPEPPAPVGAKQPRASTADIDAFLTSVANGAGISDDELNAVAVAPRTPDPDAQPAYQPPQQPYPAAFSEPPLSAAKPFELELGEFTNIGAAPLISFGQAENAPIAVGVGPKPAPRAAAPSLPPPIAMVAATQVGDADEKEPTSKKTVILIIAAALLVAGGAVTAFLLLAE